MKNKFEIYYQKLATLPDTAQISKIFYLKIGKKLAKISSLN